jgi:uncharacterized damage-inducible protein DinB
MKKTLFVLACSLAAVAGVGARQQTPPAAPPDLVTEVKNTFNRIAGFITKAADQFPEDKYTWAPTPQVRSWARLIGHIVDDQYAASYGCGGLAGVATPPKLETLDTPDSAANKMSKADLTKALAAAFDTCAKAFTAVTPANMLERNGTRSKIGTLMYHTAHTNEHYGNIVTYMRLQNLVPPSSAGRGGLVPAR